MHLDFVRAGAAPLRCRPASALRRDRRAARRADHPLQPERAGRRGRVPARAAHDERDLAGLPEGVARRGARGGGGTRRWPIGWVITLSRSLIVPVPHLLRPARPARAGRSTPGPAAARTTATHDNRPIAREILALRHEQARLHGYATYADYALVDRMAGTPEPRWPSCSTQVWEPAQVPRAAAERGCAGRAIARSRGATHAIEPWDWRYYAEKVRATRYGFDDAQLKPYFSLERMLEAAFDSRAAAVRPATSSSARTCRAYHPDVRVYEVRGRDGASRRRLPQRQLRAPDQARRRVDERLPRAVAARRRRAADRRQQQQLRQGAGGRADAAVGRRCAHAVPRVRPRPARPAVGRHATSACRARRCCATSSNCRRRSSSTGRSSPRCSRATRCITPPASRFPTTLIAQLDAGAALQPGLRDGRVHRLRAGRHGAARADRRRRRRHRPPSSARSSSGSACRARSCCGTGCRTSGTCSRAPATRPATTSTCGPRCSTPTATTPSSRPATRSTPRCAERLLRYIYSSGGTLDRRRRRIRLFRGRDPRIGPMLAERGLAEAAAAR